VNAEGKRLCGRSLTSAFSGLTAAAGPKAQRKDPLKQNLSRDVNSRNGLAQAGVSNHFAS